MREAAPYASVIVPTHNRASTLPHAVASIQAQTVRNIEIVIVGDGVDAPTRAAAQSLASADSRIVFRDLPKAPRAGVVHRHNAVRIARSSRIFYSDDDDLLQPHHVETLGPHLDTHDVAESLPASLSLSGRVEVALVNHALEPMRACLAGKRLKLTFDTHIAHRRDAYLSLGAPWLSDAGGIAGPFLAALAGSPRLRWKSIPQVTALSLHGASRKWMSSSQRAEEMVRVLPLLGSSLLRIGHLEWYLLRLWTTAPELLDLASVDAMLARLGFVDSATADDQTSVPDLLPTEDARSELERLLTALRGEEQNPASLVGLALRLCEPLLGGFPRCDRVANVLMPTVGEIDVPCPDNNYAQEMSCYLRAILAMRRGNICRALEILDELPPTALVHPAYRLQLCTRAFYDSRRYSEAIACAKMSIAEGNDSRTIRGLLARARLARTAGAGFLFRLTNFLSRVRHACPAIRH